MPITSVDVRAGDPTVQLSGQHRGTVEATFADGRAVSKYLRAPDLASWDALVASMNAVMQEDMEARDATEAVSPEAEIDASGEASIAQTCVAYIRRAWEEPQAYDAWNLYSRINTYVNAHSDWNTAHTHLLAEGLTQEEFDQAKAAYQYLSGASRPTTMSDFETIQSAWESQH